MLCARGGESGGGWRVFPSLGGVGEQAADGAGARERRLDAFRPRRAGAPSQILRGVVVYVGGSTAPLVSDHGLRRLVARHGGGVSACLARRSVTHVVLAHKTPVPPPADGPGGAQPRPSPGGPAAAAAASGSTARAAAGHGRPFRAAGGGLAAGKLQREIAARRGAGIKYVTAAWILESIKAGRRLPEVAVRGLERRARTAAERFDLFWRREDER